MTTTRGASKRASEAEANGTAAVADSAKKAKTEVEAAGVMKNSDGLEYVKLVSGKSSAEIYLFGGVVTSYIKDDVEFIRIRPDAKMDGSKPISGGLSHCWPQFGPGTIQQHGFARNVTWTLKSSNDKSCVMEMKPNDYTKGMWPKQDFCVTFNVELTDEQLTTEMKVECLSGDSFDFQAALHSYLACSSLKNLSLTGSFEGKDFLNRLAGDDGKGETQKETRKEITIEEEYDRIYKGINDFALNDTGTKTSLKLLNEKGWVDTVVWNPYGSEKMGYDTFVCVESVKYDPVTLKAGESWDGVLILKPETL